MTIITISGTPGSGKSTIARAISKEFNLNHLSAGDFVRQLAEERNMTLIELNKLAETDPSIDKEIDNRTKKLAKKDNFVIDSRLAFHFIPDSVKVFVKCSDEVAAERIHRDTLNSLRSSEDRISSLEDAVDSIKRRKISERKRYESYYNIDIDDESNFDIVIDTSNLGIQEGIDIAIEKVRPFLEENI